MASSAGLTFSASAGASTATSASSPMIHELAARQPARTPHPREPGLFCGVRRAAGTKPLAEGAKDASGTDASAWQAGYLAATYQADAYEAGADFIERGYGFQDDIRSET